MPKLAITTFLSLTLAGCILGRPPLPMAASQEAPSRRSASDIAIERVEQCARAYAAAQLRSITTATEIAEAAVAACQPQEVQYADAYLSERGRDLSDLEYLNVRRISTSGAADLARQAALRVIVEARKLPQPDSLQPASAADKTT